MPSLRERIESNIVVIFIGAIVTGTSFGYTLYPIINEENGIEQRYAELKNSHNELQSRYDTLNTTIVSLNSEQRILKSKYSDLLEERKILAASSEQLNKKVSEQAIALSNHLTLKRKTEESINKCESEYKELQPDLTECRNDLLTEKSKFNKCEEDFKNSAKKVSNSKASLEKMVTFLSNANSQADSVSKLKDLAACKSTVELIKIHIKEATHALTEARVSMP